MLKEHQFSRMQRDQVSSLLSTAIDFSPDTRLGSKTQLRVPAAVRWLHIEGNDFKRFCAADTANASRRYIGRAAALARFVMKLDCNFGTWGEQRSVIKRKR
jgi:hypothetical protein